MATVELLPCCAVRSAPAAARNSPELVTPEPTELSLPPAVPPIKVGRVTRNADLVRKPFEPKFRVAEINDYLTCFYDGRNAEDYPAWLHQNIDMQLGVCCYVLHRGHEAIVFDTMLYREHILWIDAYLRDAGITRISVINSHWDCDHVAGNFLYRDSDIIASAGTRRMMAFNAELLRTGEIWAMAGDPNHPGIEEVVLPNRTFEGRMTVYLGDLRIDLIETFLHQVGHLVAYLPKDRILLAADALEDTVPFNSPALASDLPRQLAAFRSLLAMDIAAIYPCHGRFEVIASGGYTQEFTAAMLDYSTQLILRRDEPDYLDAPLESFIGPWLDRGTLALHEPYRALHDVNTGLARRSYGGVPIVLPTAD